MIAREIANIAALLVASVLPVSVEVQPDTILVRGNGALLNAILDEYRTLLWPGNGWRAAANPAMLPGRSSGSLLLDATGGNAAHVWRAINSVR